MDRYKSNFKKPSSDHVDNKNKRVGAMARNRKDTRGKSFAARRNVPEAEPEETGENLAHLLPVNNENKLNESNKPVPQKIHMQMRLQKWKEEKQKQKVEKEKIKARIKPPFKVGVVRHDDTVLMACPTIPSAVSNFVQRPVAKPYDFSAYQPSLARPMTQNNKATAFPIGVSNASTKNGTLSTRKQVAQSTSTQKQQPNVQMRSLRSRNVPIMTARTPSSKTATPLPLRNPFGNATPNVTYKRCYDRVTPFRFGQASKSVVLKTPKSAKKENTKVATVEIKPQSIKKASSVKSATGSSKSNSFAQEPQKIEPALSDKVTVLRGGRKSRNKTSTAGTSQKDEESHPIPDADVGKPQLAQVDMSSDKTEEEHDCAYFRRILATTIAELEQKCEHWVRDLNAGGNSVSEVAQDQLLLAKGMAHLLIREKFAQFRGLIENCEANSPVSRTTCTDLQGFWDMIYIQVGDINDKFKELEYMKNNNWVPLEKRSGVKVAQKKKNATKPKPAPAKARSNFKAFLAASKKNKEETSVDKVNEESESAISAATVARRSLMRTSISTPQRKMSISSPTMGAILNATSIAKAAGRKSSLIDKAVDVSQSFQGDGNAGDSVLITPRRKSLRQKLPPIPDKTPLRSILKKSQAANENKRGVFFNTTVQELYNEDAEDNSLDTPKFPIIHTYGSSPSSSISPVTDKFDELLLSPSKFHNVAHPLKPATIVEQLETLVPSSPFANIKIAFRDDAVSPASRKRVKPPTPYVVRTGGKDTEDDDGSPGPAPKKVFKPPTPHVARKGRRSGRMEVPDEDEASSVLLEPHVPSSMTPVITQEMKGRKNRYSPYGGRKASVRAPNTPDLISWDTPESKTSTTDTKGLRKSKRISKSITNTTS